MQLKLGEKIRELRKAQGRKQEDLARALGVSSQAVSRWEANGGYPDMETIPAIANYFHITIDELFGYDNDREFRLKEIEIHVGKMLNSNEDLDLCIDYLRNALSEFPEEPMILENLGYALTKAGWQKHGARSISSEDSDYIHEDLDYNRKNIYWKEALSIFEKVLVTDINPDSKVAILSCAIPLYAKLGEYDKSESLARKQDSIKISSEILLAYAANEKDKSKYRGEALIALLRETKNILEASIVTKQSHFKATGIKNILSLIALYESVFEDGNCGLCHVDLRDLYVLCAVFTAKQGDADTALTYFDKAFNHNQKYISIKSTGIYHYTSPLVSEVTFPSENFPADASENWNGMLEVLPENLMKIVKENYSQFSL